MHKNLYDQNTRLMGNFWSAQSDACHYKLPILDILVYKNVSKRVKNENFDIKNLIKNSIKKACLVYCKNNFCNFWTPIKKTINECVTFYRHLCWNRTWRGRDRLFPVKGRIYNFKKPLKKLKKLFGA